MCEWRSVCVYVCWVWVELIYGQECASHARCNKADCFRNNQSGWQRLTSSLTHARDRLGNFNIAHTISLLGRTLLKTMSSLYTLATHTHTVWQRYICSHNEITPPTSILRAHTAQYVHAPPWPGRHLDEATKNIYIYI